MSKKFIIFVLVVVAIVTGIYTYVGGFSPVTISQTITSEMRMVGKPFAGDPDSKELGDIYLEVGQALEQKKLTGDLGGIFYNNPTETQKIIKAFIGVVVKDSIGNIPPGFEIQTVAAGMPVLQGSLDASMMVAPKKIYTALFDYAEDKEILLQEFYIERFPENQPAVIQIRRR